MMRFYLCTVHLEDAHMTKHPAIVLTSLFMTLTEFSTAMAVKKLPLNLGSVIYYRWESCGMEIRGFNTPFHVSEGVYLAN